MTQGIDIDAMTAADWASVRAIYAEGLATGLAAFTTSPPLWAAWNASHLDSGRLVARREQAVVGFAALSRVADT